jgi:transcriptional regulator with XRE-family HTH domain
MSTSLELAHQLEAARLASGLTRQELTSRAGVSRQAVYRLFKGSDVQLSTLLAVMEVLQLDLVTLPRSLKRGMPEFGVASSVPHAPSAVQQRLARLKQGAAAPKGRP